jgi:hypothetical protein
MSLPVLAKMLVEKNWLHTRQEDAAARGGQDQACMDTLRRFDH